MPRRTRSCAECGATITRAAVRCVSCNLKRARAAFSAKADKTRADPVYADCESAAEMILRWQRQA